MLETADDWLGSGHPVIPYVRDETRLCQVKLAYVLRGKSVCCHYQPLPPHPPPVSAALPALPRAGTFGLGGIACTSQTLSRCSPVCVCAYVCGLQPPPGALSLPIIVCTRAEISRFADVGRQIPLGSRGFISAFTGILLSAQRLSAQIGAALRTVKRSCFDGDRPPRPTRRP